jgi:hypothetical protein
MKQRVRAAAPAGLVGTDLVMGVSTPLQRLLRAIAARPIVWAAALGAALVLLVGIPLSAALNIWIDEAFTLHTTGAGPLNAWAQAVAFEAQPPLYFVLEALWRSIDETSIAFARFPSVVFAAAAVAVMVGAASRITPRTPPLVVVLVTAFNPIVIWASVEMRVYALVLLVGAVLTWTFFEGFLVSRPSRTARIAYVVFALAGLYTQYYVGFVLAAQFITLLALRRDRIRAISGALAIVGVGFAPFVTVALMHLAASGDFVSHVTFVRALRDVANAIFIFVLPHDDGWAGARKYAGWACSAAVVFVVCAIGRPALPEPETRAAAVELLVCLTIFSVLFGALGVPLDPLRHLIVLAPASLIAALAFVTSATRRRMFAGSFAGAMFALFVVTRLWAQYHLPLAKQGDWKSVASTLAADDASTPIAVFPAELAFPLSVYLPVETVSIPKPMPFTYGYVAATTLTDESEVARVLDPVRARAQRLWVVTGGECRELALDGYNYHCRFLETFLDRRYRLERSVVFRGALARLYVRVPGVSLDSRVMRGANERLARR